MQQPWDCVTYNGSHRFRVVTSAEGGATVANHRQQQAGLLVQHNKCDDDVNSSQPAVVDAHYSYAEDPDAENSNRANVQWITVASSTVSSLRPSAREAATIIDGMEEEQEERSFSTAAVPYTARDDGDGPDASSGIPLEMCADFDSSMVASSLVVEKTNLVDASTHNRVASSPRITDPETCLDDGSGPGDDCGHRRQLLVVDAAIYNAIVHCHYQHMRHCRHNLQAKHPSPRYNGDRLRTMIDNTRGVVRMKKRRRNSEDEAIILL